jgi:hypothetical protein
MLDQNKGMRPRLSFRGPLALLVVAVTDGLDGSRPLAPDGHLVPALQPVMRSAGEGLQRMHHHVRRIALAGQVAQHDVHRVRLANRHARHTGPSLPARYPGYA